MIEIRNVSKAYKKKKVLDDVSFSIEKNQITGLVGPNGAGKSTMLRIISGINIPTYGMVISENDMEGRNVKISTVFDYDGLYSQLTVRENILFLLKTRNKNVRDLTQTETDIIERLGLKDVLDTKVRFFSKGMLRKAAIARAVIMNPNILILDEPFDGLDIESHSFIIGYLQEWVCIGQRCILLSSHNMSDVEKICDRIIILNEGRIIKDASVELLREQAYKCLRISLMADCDKSLIYNSLPKESRTDYYEKGGKLWVRTEQDKIPNIISNLCSHGVAIMEAAQERSSLEELYLDILKGRKDEKSDK